jgi:hypothetical protein
MEYSGSEHENEIDNENAGFEVQQPRDRVLGVPYKKEDDEDNDDISRSATIPMFVTSDFAAQISLSDGMIPNGAPNGGSDGAFTDSTSA